MSKVNNENSNFISYFIQTYSKKSNRQCSFDMLTVNMLVNYILFFYEQPVYKQLALEWQIAMQLSGLNSLSLSNDKSYRLKKSGVFLYNKRETAVQSQPAIACSKLTIETLEQGVKYVQS